MQHILTLQKSDEYLIMIFHEHEKWSKNKRKDHSQCTIVFSSSYKSQRYVISFYKIPASSFTCRVSTFQRHPQTQMQHALLSIPIGTSINKAKTRNTTHDLTMQTPASRIFVIPMNLSHSKKETSSHLLISPKKLMHFSPALG